MPFFWQDFSQYWFLGCLVCLFFLWCITLYYSLVSLESFRAHYTDNTCLKCFCTSFKAKTLRVEMNVTNLYIKLLIKLLVFQSPYKWNNEEKVYFRVHTFLVCHKDFSYLHGNYQGEKLLYFVYQKAEWGLLPLCVYVCVWKEGGKIQVWKEKGLNYCNSSIINFGFSLAVTKASLWRSVSFSWQKVLSVLKECQERKNL